MRHTGREVSRCPPRRRRRPGRPPRSSGTIDSCSASFPASSPAGATPRRPPARPDDRVVARPARGGVVCRRRRHARRAHRVPVHHPRNRGAARPGTRARRAPTRAGGRRISAAGGDADRRAPDAGQHRRVGARPRRLHATVRGPASRAAVDRRPDLLRGAGPGARHPGRDPARARPRRGSRLRAPRCVRREGDGRHVRDTPARGGRARRRVPTASLLEHVGGAEPGAHARHRRRRRGATARCASRGRPCCS